MALIRGGVAKQCLAKAMQRIEEICKGMAEQGSDEQWNCMEPT